MQTNQYDAINVKENDGGKIMMQKYVTLTCTTWCA
jgi:hypothetical protein